MHSRWTLLNRDSRSPSSRAHSPSHGSDTRTGFCQVSYTDTVIPHNCSEMHRNVAIPDYRSLVTQTSGIDICQIGYDICEFDSLRGLGIDIIGRVHFDNRYRFVIWMGSIGKATEPCQQTSGCWHLTFDSFLNLDMGDDTNTNFLLLRVQTTYMTWEVIVGGTWLIMLGFMDLWWPRVCRRSTSVLFLLCEWYMTHTLLTHLPIVPHICVKELGQHWFK